MDRCLLILCVSCTKLWVISLTLLKMSTILFPFCPHSSNIGVFSWTFGSSCAEQFHVAGIIVGVKCERKAREKPHQDIPPALLGPPVAFSSHSGVFGASLAAASLQPLSGTELLYVVHHLRSRCFRVFWRREDGAKGRELISLHSLAHDWGRFSYCALLLWGLLWVQESHPCFGFW